MHISSCLTIPTNFFGLTVVMFCEKKHMGTFRWHLMFYQVFSMFSDLLINSGILPIIFSPFPIGIPNGFLNVFLEFFEISYGTWIQCEIMFSFLFMTALGVEMLFLYRYQAILPINHVHRLSSFSYFLILSSYQFLWLSLQFVAFSFAVPDQSTAKQHFVSLYPNLAPLIHNKRSMVVAVHITVPLIMFLLVCVTRLATGLFICGWLVLMSKNALEDLILSPKTKMMHSRLINTLCFQVSIPVITFYIPLAIVIAPIILFIENTAGSETSENRPNSRSLPEMFLFLAVFVSFHTFFGTLSLLYCNKPYRAWLSRCIKRKSILVSMNTTSDAKRVGRNNLTAVF